MDFLTLITLGIFITGYLFISLEHNLRVNKSAVALAVGGLLWILASIIKPDDLRLALTHSSAEIFEIVIFLLAAMSLVEVLVHYQFFDLLRQRIHRYNLDDKRQFLLLTTMTFFLSAVIDNLTATLVMLFIAKQFFSKTNLIYVAAAIVITANAGGAFSPLGDVTTIMLWLAGKFTATQIILRGFLPSLAMGGVAVGLIYPKITQGDIDTDQEEPVTLARSEKAVIGLTFACFSMPLIMSVFKLPPYIGLLLGLGVVWFVVDALKQVSKHKTHLEVSLEKLIAKTDLGSIKFFVGILLAVSALNHVGILSHFGDVVYGNDPSQQRIITGNVSMGLISAVLDNVPLTAMSLQILDTNSISLWILLAISVGTGGSLLVVGSAAGVIAMGSIKGLSFKKYLSVAFVPVLIAYTVAIAVWYGQFLIFPTADPIPPTPPSQAIAAPDTPQH